MKEYKFDTKLDGEPPQVSEYLTPIVTQAELHVNLYAHRLMRSSAVCGCASCKGSAIGLIDWLFYPTILEKQVKLDIFNQLKERARSDRK